MFSTVLFDLDGTLIDTSEGIISSIRKTLRGLKIQEKNDLSVFVGPPLKLTFMKEYSLDDEKATEATKIFREYYSKEDKFKGNVYDGIYECLSLLKNNKIDLFVATSKPTIFSEEILRHFNMSDYFTEVVGSNLDNSRSKKNEVIEYILEKYGIKNKNSVLMVGDTDNDLIGANISGIRCVGVTYGFGSYSQLIKIRNDGIIDSINELSKLVLNR